MSGFISVLIDQNGNEFFDAYGPATRTRDEAAVYVSRAVAAKAVENRFGFSKNAFWPSEIAADLDARKKYHGWKYRIEEIANEL